MEKRELRAQMKRRNLSLGPSERAAASRRIFGRVERLPGFIRARTVAVFAALGDEPDTAEALARWSRARKLVVPRVEGETMRFFSYDPATMRPGAFGIAEPGPEAVPCDPTEIDLCVVPGVAFSASGMRLGRGRGYYDRYLAQTGVRALKIGVCYAHQLVGGLPVQPHDVRMDCVISDVPQPEAETEEKTGLPEAADHGTAERQITGLRETTGPKTVGLQETKKRETTEQETAGLRKAAGPEKKGPETTGSPKMADTKMTDTEMMERETTGRRETAAEETTGSETMTPEAFAGAFREAFGEAAPLPLAFWYSDAPLREVPKTQGCFFKALGEARDGRTVSLGAGNIGCGGGKFYTGFAPMPEHVPGFVSEKEHYKRTPEMVRTFIERLGVPAAPGAWLHFARVDTLERFDGIEGVLFFATPDVLAGLVAWAAYDNNDDDAVAAPFGSGCSSVVTQVVQENRRGGRRTFLALFDPSVRPWVGKNELGFAVPARRFSEMCGTMRASCLFGTHAWRKVRDRINEKQ